MSCGFEDFKLFYYIHVYTDKMAKLNANTMEISSACKSIHSSWELLCPSSKKRVHIALHMLVSLCVGRFIRLELFGFWSITRECLDLPFSNFFHTFFLVSRWTLLILGWLGQRSRSLRVKCVHHNINAYQRFIKNNNSLYKNKLIKYLHH